ncbi:MAG: membrane dipeptidase [Bacteroidota bacterium]
MKNQQGQYLIFDAHLDLAMNAMEWNRDLRWEIDTIRDWEKGMSDLPDRGNGTVSFPAMRQGNIGLCVATQIARYAKRNHPRPGWRSPEQAWAMTQAQLAWYRQMENAGEIRQIRDKPTLQQHLAHWQNGEAHTIGYILSLEGADSLVEIEYLETAHAYGLRALGPAHYGPGTYAQGTNASGGIGQKGKALLRKMESLNIILDATHLCDESFWEALDHFNGPVWASHHNCRAIVDHNRQLSDEQIKTLLERKAVIGAVFDGWMTVPGWVRGKSTPEAMELTMEKIVDHIDHICQLAGNAKHVAIGSDLDGAFGKEQSPMDVESIADLQTIPSILQKRGYSESDIIGIMSGNWIDFLMRVWE